MQCFNSSQRAGDMDLTACLPAEQRFVKRDCRLCFVAES